MTEGISQPQLAAESRLTGHPAIDEVVAALDALDGLPVDDHVAVFERAHQVLREALDTRPDS